MASPRKIKLKLKAVRPRNPLVGPARARKAGTHRKSESAQRRAAKVALQKQHDDT